MRGLGLFAAFLAAMCAQAKADEIVKLGPADLGVQTHKWEGKTIETTAYCFYADVHEYRCASPGGPRLDFDTLEPDMAKDSIEAHCGTLASAFSAACKVKIRFVYGQFDKMKNDDGTSLSVILVKDGKGTIVK